jgi:hypothetical protein
LGADLRMDTKKTCVEREYLINLLSILDKLANLIGGDLYNHLLTWRIITFDNEYDIQTCSKITRKVDIDTIWIC